SGQYERLKVFLTDLKTLRLVMDNDELDAIAYWQRLRGQFDMAPEYLRALRDWRLEGSPEDGSKTLYIAGAFLEISGQHEAAETALRLALRIDETHFGA